MSLALYGIFKTYPLYLQVFDVNWQKYSGSIPITSLASLILVIKLFNHLLERGRRAQVRRGARVLRTRHRDAHPHEADSECSIVLCVRC